METMDQARATGVRARWTRLATLGFVFAAVSPLLLLLAVLAWGLETEGETAFFVIIAGVAAVAAFLVYRFGTWAKVVGAVLGTLMSLALWWTAFGLFVPASFFEFMSGLLLIPGAILAVVACVAAIVAKRRGHLSAGAEGGERKAVRVALAIVALLAVVSGVLTVASRSTVGESEAASAATTSVMKDFDFVPVAYTVAGGEKILVKNDDPFMHTFTVEALGIDVVVTPGSEKLVSIPSKPGTYVLYCKPHGDPEEPEENDMNGTLTVR